MDEDQTFRLTKMKVETKYECSMLVEGCWSACSQEERVPWQTRQAGLDDQQSSVAVWVKQQVAMELSKDITTLRGSQAKEMGKWGGTTKTLLWAKHQPSQDKLYTSQMALKEHVLHLLSPHVWSWQYQFCLYTHHTVLIKRTRRSTISPCWPWMIWVGGKNL